MTQTVLPTEMAPEVARIAPLLLLLSRERLAQPEEERARALAAALSPGRGDWATLVRIAAAKRSLPFVHHHVAGLGLLPEDAPERALMKRATMAHTMQWLRHAAAQKAFQETCLAPGAVPHLFFKGVALARYYAQPGLRIARDIDVLVRPQDVRAVVERAMEAGYQVILDRHTGRMTETKQDLEAVLHYKRDVPLWAPQNVQIELHTDIWHGAGFSDTDSLIASAETAQIQGAACRVMPTAPLFVYLAHHHNRHLWSSLNWLADIAAIRQAPDFDEGAVRALARRMELEPVVEATLAFDDLIRGAAPTQGALARERAEECRHFCELNLEGDVDTERGLYFERIPPDADWRVPPRLRESDRHRKWRSRLTPSIDQYNALRLPLWLHWVYPVQRALRAGVLRVGGAVRGNR